MVILKKQKDMSSEVLHEVCGGVGDTAVRYLLEEDEMEGKFTKLAYMTIAPGATFGVHDHLSGKNGIVDIKNDVPFHFDNAELYLVLKGEVWTGEVGKEETLRAGDVSYVTGGSVHHLENRSDQPAEVLAVLAP